MKAIYLNIKYFFINAYFVYFSNKVIPKSFAGYGRFALAKKYADKRTDCGSVDGVTGRKRHYVIAYDTNILMVCNRIEMNNMIRSKVIKKLDIYALIKDAYYITK